MLFEVSPSPEKALELINSSSWRPMILLVGECSVTYQGRAKSFLDYGERLVIIKKDGSVLVHQGEKREPVNWQPPGTRPSYHLQDGVLVVKAQRVKSREFMTVDFRSIDLLAIKSLTDKASLQLVGMEEDIVEYIMEDPSLIEEGLRVSKKERRTSSGSIDLFCRDRDNTPVIVEVKRSQPGISAVYQLESYVADFRRKNPDCNIRAFLIAPRISSMVKNMLKEKCFEFKEIKVSFDLADDDQRRLEDWGMNESG